MSDADDHVPILIVGGCTTGLTAACELARRGVRFRIIEKNDGIVQTARAVGLQGRSLEIFKDLGVRADFNTVGVPLRAKRTFLDGVSSGRQAFPILDRAFPLNVSMPQYMTEALLEARLNELGAVVRAQHETDRPGGARGRAFARQ